MREAKKITVLRVCSVYVLLHEYLISLMALSDHDHECRTRVYCLNVQTTYSVVHILPCMMDGIERDGVSRCLV